MGDGKLRQSDARQRVSSGARFRMPELEELA
uniref:Uncharacterized protein n=1 Tax=Arundo donax TaxID=35708 RepID=A0A0A9GX78_ARUDO